MKEIQLERETESGDFGTIEGYICGIQEENVFNWLVSLDCEDNAKKIIDYLISQNATSVAIIKGIQVPEEDRNKGHGDALIGSFLDEAIATSFVLLECDTGEINSFSLKEWYEDFGFESFINVTKLKDLEGIKDLMFLRMD